MKIKVALIANDRMYVERIHELFPRRYGQMINIIAFTEENLLLEYMKYNPVDILLCEFENNLNIASLSSKTRVAYLVEEDTISKIDGFSTVGKYQSLEKLYEQILYLYDSDFIGEKRVDKGAGNCSIISVIGVEGGIGSTTVALALAYSQVQFGKKVLYFSLEDFGSGSAFFTKKDGEFSFSDVLVSFKRSREQVLVKIDQNVNVEGGIHYFSHCHSPFDLFETGAAPLQELLNIIQKSKKYDVIIINQDPILAKLQFYEGMENLLFIFVSNGKKANEKKLENLTNIMTILSNKYENNGSYADVKVVYNCCDTEVIKFRHTLENALVIGSIPMYGAHSTQQLVEHIATTSQFLQNITTKKGVTCYAG